MGNQFRVEVVGDKTAARDLMTPTVFALSLDKPAARVVEDMLALKVSNGPDVCGFARSSRSATARPQPASAFSRQKSTVFPERNALSQPTAFLRHRLC
jgi:hypothetical protein